MLKGKKIILELPAVLPRYKACYIIRGLIKTKGSGSASRNYSGK